MPPEDDTGAARGDYGAVVRTDGRKWTDTAAVSAHGERRPGTLARSDTPINEKGRRVVRDGPDILPELCSFAERDVLIRPDFARQAKDALCDDVAQDLIRATCNTQTGRADIARLEA